MVCIAGGGKDKAIHVGLTTSNESEVVMWFFFSSLGALEVCRRCLQLIFVDLRDVATVWLLVLRGSFFESLWKAFRFGIKVSPLITTTNHCHWLTTKMEPLFEDTSAFRTFCYVPIMTFTP